MCQIFMQYFYRPPYQVYTKYTKSDQLSTTKSDQNIVVDRFAPTKKHQTTKGQGGTAHSVPSMQSPIQLLSRA
jgi:hypothetical protein